MAAYYYASNREGGSTQNSLAVGVPTIAESTATQTAYDFELRINTVDGQGNVPTEKDVITFLDKLRSWMINGIRSDGSVFPPL